MIITEISFVKFASDVAQVAKGCGDLDFQRAYVFAVYI